MADIVLSVSGGGILGVGPAHFLARLEKDLGKSISLVFNGFGGTSTGAIIAGALDEGISASDIEKLYKEHGKDIFKEYTWWEKVKALNKPLPKYNNVKLKEILQDMMKGNCSDWKKEIFIPAVNMIAVKNDEKVFDRGDVTVPKWFAVIASTSAPTYFMPAGTEENWIDGGMVANNPAAVLAAGYKNRAKKNNFKILHLETGMLNTKKGEGGNKNLVGWGTYIVKNFVARSESTNSYIAKCIVGPENFFEARPITNKTFKMDNLDCMDEVIDIWDKYYDVIKPELLKFLK